jgi:tetratricopeptide (TPR) repeat protein
MIRYQSYALPSLGAVALFALMLATTPALANASPPSPPPTDSGSGNGDSRGTDDKSKPKAMEPTATEGYARAYELIYRHDDFAAGMAALRTIGCDDDADVATLMGYASRKLGHYDEARDWYEKALASDPNHTRTWQYYGMWHLEQGNRLKAADYLAKIELICGGTACKEYKDLRGALDGTVSY